MRLTITSLRRNLYKLVEAALQGEPVEFTHKGVVFRIVPESAPSKLTRLTAQKVLDEAADLEQVSQDLLAEMRSEWEKDWAEL